MTAIDRHVLAGETSLYRAAVARFRTLGRRRQQLLVAFGAAEEQAQCEHNHNRSAAAHLTRMRRLEKLLERNDAQTQATIVSLAERASRGNHG